MTMMKRLKMIYLKRMGGGERTKARIMRSVCFNKDIDPEKHYRELIMLFTAWRNEQIDLFNSCSSYEERFFQVKSKVDEQMKEYAICTKDLNDTEDQLRHNKATIVIFMIKLLQAHKTLSFKMYTRVHKIYILILMKIMISQLIQQMIVNRNTINCFKKQPVDLE